MEMRDVKRREEERRVKCTKVEERESLNKVEAQRPFWSRWGHVIAHQSSKKQNALSFACILTQQVSTTISQ